MIVPGDIYQHYKGPCYRIIAVGTHTETEDEYVIYEPVILDHNTWVRPIGMFFETVEWPQGSGNMVSRFTKVTN